MYIVLTCIETCGIISTDFLMSIWYQHECDFLKRSRSKIFRNIFILNKSSYIFTPGCSQSQYAQLEKEITVNVFIPLGL